MRNKEAKNANNRKYSKTLKGKQSKKRYDLSEKGIARNRAYRAKWNELNPDKVAQYYLLGNTPEKRNPITAKRRASKVNAMPQWADKDKIALIYVKCKFMEWFTREQYHVDHIIPLQGKDVCGLHTEANLQVIPAKHNRVKSNNFEG